MSYEPIGICPVCRRYLLRTVVFRFGVGYVHKECEDKPLPEEDE